MRWATLVLLTLVACSDLRDFRGTWRGPRVGDQDVLKVGIPEGSATLSIETIASHELAARLAIDGVLPETPIRSLRGSEADVLAGMTFGGALRVYLAFVAIPDARGDALVVIALYEDHRIEVRVLRGGSAELYGIYALTESPP